MPLYEYICLDCGHQFEELRPMNLADSPIACQKCDGTHSSRKISVFSAHSDGKVISSGSPACTSCPTHHCSSCGSLN